MRYPAGPWQFFKHNLAESRWGQTKFVRFFIRDNPIKYVEVTLTANAYYPDVAIPGRQAFVEILVNSLHAR